ncbi:MAG: NifB/NifX family molybdenum-iron cluster-binding protein [Lachnospiraceae bacterium]|nr:NifB/NifX family molybdenum-iron cluster-binding protein [Lachnospiraceae bacterium]
MKIAVTYDETTGEVFQHFGKTENFKVYQVEDGKIVSGEVVSTNGEGHGALAGVLQGLQAEVLICGGIGGGAQSALAEIGIKLYGGVTGNCDDAVEAFVAGNLKYQEDVKCDHHGEHHHHEGGCGHSCSH